MDNWEIREIADLSYLSAIKEILDEKVCCWDNPNKQRVEGIKANIDLCIADIRRRMFPK